MASCDRCACVCFLFLTRSDHGTIVHTGDWKIDENPVDGQAFDRTTFDLLSELALVYRPLLVTAQAFSAVPTVLPSPNSSRLAVCAVW